MSSARSPRKAISAERRAAEFKRRNNREPRNANELLQFSKKGAGAALTRAEARKYFEKSPKGNRESRSATEEKSAESKEEKQEELPKPSYSVGDEVMLTKERTGVIKFVGAVEFAEGLYYGVELHEQFMGKCDGTKEGKRYFECGPQRGLLVKEKKIRRKMTRSDHARKDSWMALHAEKRARVSGTSEPTVEEEKEFLEEEIAPEEPMEDANDTETETETESDQSGNSSEEQPAEPESVADEEQLPVEENVAEDVAEGADGDDEQQLEEEKADITDEIVSAEPIASETEPQEAEPVEDLAADPEPEMEQNVQLEQHAGVESADLEYYPASEGDILLTFIHKQPHSSLRSDLLDLYVDMSVNEFLKLVFEDLKLLRPQEQRELLCNDLVPRLKQSRC